VSALRGAGVISTVKTCTRCLRTLPVEDFDLKRPDKPWRFSRCRSCKREVAAENRRERAAQPKPPPVVVEPFPHDDFLRWRELCCGYRSIRSGLYVRATNQWFHSDAFARLQSSKRLLVCMPPAHNKSTFYAVEFPTWRIMDDRDVRIAVVQKNADEAKKTIGAVEQRLSDFDYYDYLIAKLIEQGDDPIVHPLRAWFPEPFKPLSRKVGETWGATAFRVAGRRSGERDYSMQAFGVMGPIQGGRFDHVILDDVQDPREASRFPVESAHKLQWLEDVILGRISDTQGLTILGNHFSDEDFIARVIDAHPEFDVVEYPALIPEDPDDPDSELVPLWPEYWTTEALEKKRIEVGPRTWSVTWMSDPSGSDEHATFRRPLLEAARNEELKLGELPLDVSDVFIGVDPAVAASGFCAIVAWGLCRKTKQRYLIDVFNRSGMRTWDNVADAIIAIGRPYAAELRLRSCVIELASTQESLVNHDRLRKQLASLGAKVKVYKTATGTGARSESDSFDITTIGGLFDESLITLPYGGTYEDRKRVDDYIDQLCAWRTDDEGHSIKHLKRDMVMATLFAESEAFMLANRPESKVKLRSQVRPPRWVMNRHRELYQDARELAELQREHDEKVAAAQAMAQRIGPLG
jgi:hypothetical protein